MKKDERKMDIQSTNLFGKKSGISDKAKVLVDVIRENPYQNPPRYEKLVGKSDGIFSRRINKL